MSAPTETPRPRTWADIAATVAHFDQSLAEARARVVDCETRITEAAKRLATAAGMDAKQVERILRETIAVLVPEATPCWRCGGKKEIPDRKVFDHAAFKDLPTEPCPECCSPDSAEACCADYLNHRPYCPNDPRYEQRGAKP